MVVKKLVIRHCKNTAFSLTIACPVFVCFFDFSFFWAFIFIFLLIFPLCLVHSVQVERASGGFHIDLDDFLTGLLFLANELVGVSFPLFLLSCKLIFVHKLFNVRVYSPFGLHCNSCHVVGVQCPMSSSDFVRIASLTLVRVISVKPRHWSP